jgi:hypothetical protein
MPGLSITLNGAVLPAAPVTPVARDEPDHPDTLDADMLRIAGVCILASVMAILDTTVVSVAQRTFIVDFGSTQAIARGRDGPKYVVRPPHWLAAPPIRAADQRHLFFGHRMREVRLA